MNQPQSTLPPARAAALDAIERTLPLTGKPGQDLQSVLDQCVRRLIDPRDKALATELTYGYLRLKGRMDTLVLAHLDKPERTHPGIIRVMGVAAYELASLDTVPAHATLSWAVDAVKARFGQAQANVANAVLRRIQKLGADASAPDFYRSLSASRIKFLCAWLSCPDWLVRLWLRDYGEEATLGLLQAQLVQPLTGVRVNAALEGSRELFEAMSGHPGLAFSQYPWLGFEPAASPGLTSGLPPAEQEGRLTRQSPGVGDILARLSHQEWPEPIWDACAGRGGKASALVELGHAQVWSSDVNRRRLRGLLPEFGRLRLPSPLAFMADATRAPLAKRPGTILIDAPCSGLGVLARRPDAKWKRAPGDVATLADIQGRITTSCAGLLAPGGRLVYMTCTMTRQENERQAEAIEALGFVPEAMAEPVIEGGLREFFWGRVWKKT